MSDVAGRCAKDYFFSELAGRCKHCGELCDDPALYPYSCSVKCPDYNPNGHLPTQPPKGHKINWKSVIVPGSISLGSILLFILIAYLLWVKVFKRRYLTCARHWLNKPLKHPVQEQNNVEMVPLTTVSVDGMEAVGSLVGDSDTDNIEANESNAIVRDLELSVRTDIQNISYECENEDRAGFSSGDFSFGYTFPFNSLESLFGIFEHSGDQTRTKCV